MIKLIKGMRRIDSMLKEEEAGAALGGVNKGQCLTKSGQSK